MTIWNWESLSESETSRSWEFLVMDYLRYQIDNWHRTNPSPSAFAYSDQVYWAISPDWWREITNIALQGYDSVIKLSALGASDLFGIKVKIINDDKLPRLEVELSWLMRDGIALNLEPNVLTAKS